MGKYFGTDGFRGEANVTLTVEDALDVYKRQGMGYLWVCCGVQGDGKDSLSGCSLPDSTAFL